MSTRHPRRSSTRLLTTAATVATAAVAALALPAATASPAAAAADGPAADNQAAAPGAELSLSIIPDRPSNGNPLSTVTLTCAPDGGTHPDSTLACERLTEADGVFEDLRPSSTSCPANWDPVTITAEGVWYGREVSFTDRHSNRMCAILFTGEVFGFPIYET